MVQTNYLLDIKDLPTDQFEDRPEGVSIDTLIIHSMYNPDSDDKFSAKSCRDRLNDFGVSAHYIIDLEGAVWCCVAEEKKAWHAGVSKMPRIEDGREAVNDFSIGIELVGTEETDFTEPQYESLIGLTLAIMSRHQIKNIYAHSDIAPDRKTDPWGLDWSRYRCGIMANCNEQSINFCDVELT